MDWGKLLFLSGSGLILWHFYEKERTALDAYHSNRRLLAGDADRDQTELLPGGMVKKRPGVTRPAWDNAALRPWFISSVYRLEGSPKMPMEAQWSRYRPTAFATAWTEGIEDYFGVDSYFPRTYPISGRRFDSPKMLMQNIWDKSSIRYDGMNARAPNMVVLQPANQALIPVSDNMKSVADMGGSDAYVASMLDQTRVFVNSILAADMVVVLVGPYPYGDAPYWHMQHQVYWNRLEAGMREIANQAGVFYVDLASEFGEGGKFALHDLGIPRAHITERGGQKILVSPDWDLAEEMGLSISEVMEQAAKESGILVARQDVS